MTCTARPILGTSTLGVAGCSSGGGHADGTSASSPGGAAATVPAADDTLVPSATGTADRLLPAGRGYGCRRRRRHADSDGCHSG